MRSSLAERFGACLLPLQRKLKWAERRAFERHMPRRMTVADARVLLAVGRNGESMMAVVRSLQISKSVVSRAIKRLERWGYVKRSKVDDQVAKGLVLTTEGETVMCDCRDAESEAAAMVLAAIAGISDRTALVSLVETLLGGGHGS